MRTLWAIDPGGYDSKAKSTALVVFKHDGAEVLDLQYACMRGYDIYERLLAAPAGIVVVYEGYHSFPGQRGTTMNEHKTVQTIGAIRAACDARGFEQVRQWSSIKPHACKWVKSRGTLLVGSNQHLRDAEMHGWWYIRNLGKGN